MAHGDKKWIYDHDGRLKKSSDRTKKDWKAGLLRDKYYRWDCPDCQAHNGAYQLYWRRAICEGCRIKDRKLWGGGRGHNLGSKSNDQYGIRQNYREYRAEVKNIMNRAKYDEDFYDDIPPYKHNWLD